MISSKELFNIIREYKTSDNTIKRVRSIFTQNDIRYSDPEYEAIVAGFLDNNAISIEEKGLEKRPVNVSNIEGPQKEMKALIIDFLKQSGYKIVSIERGFMGGIPDVLAKKGDLIVAVECGPCTIRKAIDYLENENTSLWIVRPEDEKYGLFIVSKSRSWNAFLKFHRKNELKVHRKHMEGVWKEFYPGS